ncbi:MAG: L,D-transpeptidase [Cyanobacteria bacterium P01_H01_bin.74]
MDQKNKNKWDLSILKVLQNFTLKSVTNGRSLLTLVAMLVFLVSPGFSKSLQTTSNALPNMPDQEHKKVTPEKRPDPASDKAATKTSDQNQAGQKQAKKPDAVSQKKARRVVINIPSRTLWVYEGNKITHYFPVGLGRPGFMTPVGEYSIIRKVLNPGWENPYQKKNAARIAPGKYNPLGTRWMGFKRTAQGEYGIHGTNRPASVGKFSSHGCVRMKIADAEKLFELVNVGTPLRVTYDTVLIRQKGETIRVVVFADRFKQGKPTTQNVKEKILDRYPQAAIQDDALVTALRNPTERFVEVGQVKKPANAAEEI